ncbi:MAG: 2'-5' RNA ligase family protein [Rhodothermaceae bacterium]|nr:2'-5' RNA ligase family protein [Rhodothermaceae bacterium]
MSSDEQQELSGYSVWLTFGRAEKGLSKLINRLSHRFNTPVFRPHITLAGQINTGSRLLLEKTSWLASVTDPFKVRCYRFGSEESFFKTLYLEVNLSTPLRDLRNLTEKHIPLASPVFLPHISLVYEYLDHNTRNRAIADLDAILPLTADVTALTIIKTEGPVFNWHTVKEFELGN